MTIWPRRDRDGDADLAACRIVAERLRLHAAGLRVGTAALRAKRAEDDRERLAWEAQTYLALADVDKHGSAATAAAIRLRLLENE